MDNLEHNTTEIKARAMDAMDIIYARGTADVEIRGVIPLELALPTTARTSGCLFRCRYSYIEGKGYALSRA
jgi:hypothetical protein